MDRQLYTARLLRRLCLSESAQSFHLELAVDELEQFDFVPGQFVSVVADDENGKSQMRAYSIASAPRGNRFDLCLNRVENGFFSNLLCDLEPGQTIQFNGPHGYFLLRQPLTDSIFIATGTGVAPMRGFVQWLFPEDGKDRTEGHELWMVYGTRRESELYYRDYFEQIAARHPGFHYLPTLSRAPEGEWAGHRGYVQELVSKLVLERRGRLSHLTPRIQPNAGEGRGFDIHAYICGLNKMVSQNRARLKELGWDRKQIVFERYD